MVNNRISKSSVKKARARGYIVSKKGSYYYITGVAKTNPTRFFRI